MQRQAVPLLGRCAPVGTGMEYKTARIPASLLLPSAGKLFMFPRYHYIRREDDPEAPNRLINGRTGEFSPVSPIRFQHGCDLYKLQKFKRSNQGTCMNQRPIVKKARKL